MAAPQTVARRTALTQRLINKQITMEEATELFALMSRDIELLQRRIAIAPATAPAGTPPRPGAAAPPTIGTASLEDILLLAGPMLGVLAALLKRTGDNSTAGPASSRAKSGAPPGGPETPAS